MSPTFSRATLVRPVFIGLTFIVHSLMLIGCEQGGTPSTQQPNQTTTTSAARPNAELAAAPPLHTFAQSCLAAQQLPDPNNPVIDCAAPPNTFDVSTFFAADAGTEQQQSAGPTWDAWAWSSFAAINWPVKADSSDPTKFVRGVPDLGKSFAMAEAGDVLVWETFKEKRELFNKGDGQQNPDGSYPSSVNGDSKWQDYTFAAPQQVGASGGIQYCAGATPPNPMAAQRMFAQRTKAANYTDDITDTFNENDETIEVASQALEPASQLCAGLSATTSPTQTDCLQNIFPDTAVDQRTPVGPRVWKGDPGTDGNARPIYFEVKVNYDFWQYILDQGYYLDATSQAAAASADRGQHPKLPFRSSSGQGPGRSPNAVFAYSAADTVQAYQALTDANTLPGVGSIQLKAGWLVLTEAEAASGEYHTTDGVFFRTADDQPSKVCAQPATFGLLGLHIIQRVHSTAPVNREESFSYGGTFVFATWEHVGLGDYQQPSDYYYANYLAFQNNFYLENKAGGTQPPSPTNPYNFKFDTNAVPFPYFKTAGTSAINVVRSHPYPLATTAAVNSAVHNAIKQVNPNSVWLNYRLIGTQFFAANYVDTGSNNSTQPSESTFNQPFFLANLVVETNTDLQDFRGLPPNVVVTPYYTDKVNVPGSPAPPLAFQRGADNVVFNRQNIGQRNMGGCMGCHGVAQLKGFNFSFVFADGQDGSGLDTQDDFLVAGGETGAQEGED